VQWSSSTFFRSPLQADGADLAQRSGTLQIEGTFSGSGSSRVLQATKIKLKGSD
jgi:hypothetical protein